jgi:inorganic pyrophosphatase
MPVHPLHDLPSGPNPPEELNVLIEIPKGSRNKYELDKETGLLRFDRLLYSAVYYPADYGFIPRTLADDGDPMDVLVMVTEPTFPSCLVEVRPLGVFEMEDQAGHDEKILAVPLRDPLHDQYRALEDVPPHFLREVEHFFTIYKDLEGIQVRVSGWRDRFSAHGLINAAIERYRQT